MNSIIGIIICIGFMLFAYAAGYKDGRESESKEDRKRGVLRGVGIDANQIKITFSGDRPEGTDDL